MCLIAEIIHTCSHEKVAHAAVASLGSSFAGKVGATAGACGLSIGAFTARAVREFDEFSGEAERQAVRNAMDGSDQPILTGLQLILSPIIEREGAERRAGGRSSTPAGGNQTRTFSHFWQANLTASARPSI
ncbi:MAG TPA: hypothetical protein VKE72_07570 [Methylocella sp.]|nr:hypothetical protein [Methylocella sp.]